MSLPTGSSTDRVELLSDSLVKLRGEFRKLEGRVLQLEQAASAGTAHQAAAPARESASQDAPAEAELERLRKAVADAEALYQLAQADVESAQGKLAATKAAAGELETQLKESRTEALALRTRLEALTDQPWLTLVESLQARMEQALATFCEERYRRLIAPRAAQISAEKSVLTESFEAVKRILELANTARVHHAQMMSAISAQAGTVRKFIEESVRSCEGLGADTGGVTVPVLPAIAVPDWSAVSIWNMDESRVRLTAEVESWEKDVNEAVASCFDLAEQRCQALVAQLDQYLETGALDRLENQAINLHTMIYFERKQGTVAELQEPLSTLESWGRELVTRLGIEVLPCQEGVAYSSYVHVNIGAEEAPAHPPDMVLKEVAPGYRKGNQTLQLAKVIVSKR